MLRLNTYIGRQVLIGTILVTVGLACILWLPQSLRFVELIVKKGLSVGAFIHLTMLLLPNFLVIIMPIALFAVVLFTYNRLSTDRELMVMRAAGMSNWQLVRSPVSMALLFMGLGWLMTIIIVPSTVRQFREMQWSIRSDVSRVLLKEGVFTQVAAGVTVYVRSRNENGELLGILLHDQRDPKKLVTMMAERGALIQTGERPRVLMVNGNRQESKPGTGQLSLLYFDSYTMEIGGLEGENEIRFRDARERPLKELLAADIAQPSLDGSSLSDVDQRRFKVEGHQRLTSPLYFLTYALIALACLLTGAFNRQGQGGRILVAVGLMITVQAATLGVSNLATHHTALIPLMYLNPLIPAAVSLYVLLRGGRVRGGGRLGPLPAAAPGH